MTRERTNRRVLVTGGSGRLGRAVIRELTERGDRVANADLVADPKRQCPEMRADVTDLGDTVEALAGADAVVHLAAPSAEAPDHRLFAENARGTYNVLHGASVLGIDRVVLASSDGVLGGPYDRYPPAALPVDDGHTPRPQSALALSKETAERIGEAFHRWSGMTVVSLRFPCIVKESDYERFPRYWRDPEHRKGSLWSYVDARDAARACRLALDAPIAGAEAMLVAADDTVMNRPTPALVRALFPDTPLMAELGEQASLLRNERARRLLGFEPRHSWRNHVNEQ